MRLETLWFRKFSWLLNNLEPSFFEAIRGSGISNIYYVYSSHTVLYRIRIHTYLAKIFFAGIAIITLELLGNQFLIHYCANLFDSVPKSSDCVTYDVFD